MLQQIEGRWPAPTPRARSSSQRLSLQGWRTPGLACPKSVLPRGMLARSLDVPWPSKVQLNNDKPRAKRLSPGLPDPATPLPARICCDTLAIVACVVMRASFLSASSFVRHGGSTVEVMHTRSPLADRRSVPPGCRAFKVIDDVARSAGSSLPSDRMKARPLLVEKMVAV